MKKHIEIVIDLTQSREDIFKQLEEVSVALDKIYKKKSLWQRIKSWFKK